MNAVARTTGLALLLLTVARLLASLLLPLTGTLIAFLVVVFILAVLWDIVV